MKFILEDNFKKIEKNKITLILIYSVLLFFIVLATLPRIREIQDFQLINSIADGFIIVNHMYIVGFFIIPCSLIITMFMFKNDFWHNSIVRHKTRSALWIKQVIQLLLQNVFFVLFVCIAVLLVNLLFTKVGINWAVQESVFFAATKNLSNISLLVVILIYFINLLILVLISNIVFLGLFWLTDHYHYSWIVYICIYIWDLVMPEDLNIIFRKLVFGYKYWLAFPFKQINTLYFLLIMVVIIYIFKHYLKRREFFND